jgi:predicted DNA-binding transcriptional regulator AlpA
MVPNNSLAEVVGNSNPSPVPALKRLVPFRSWHEAGGFGKTTAWSLFNAGDAPPHIRIGNRVLFDVEDINAWVNARKHTRAGQKCSQ